MSARWDDAGVRGAVRVRRRRAPYRPGDLARVLHMGEYGTTVGDLEVVLVRPAGDGRWALEFAELDYTVWVGPDGRDVHGYVEPARKTLSRIC